MEYITEADKSFDEEYYNLLDKQEKAITEFSSKIVDLLNEDELSFEYKMLARSLMNKNMQILAEIEKDKDYIKGKE